MRPLLVALALSLATVSIGCFDSISETPVQGDPGSCTTCTKHSGGGGTTKGSSSSSGSSSGASSSSSGSSSSGTSSTSSSGSSSSSSSSSSSGSSSGSGSSSSGATGASSGLASCSSTGINNTSLFDCTNDPYYQGTAAPCTAGEDWLGTQVVDFTSCVPICGATASAVASTGVIVAGTQQLTDPGFGTFHYCVPANTTFEPTVTGTGYATFVYGEIKGQLSIQMPQFGMITQDTLMAFSSVISGGINMADGALVTFVFNEDGCGDTNYAAGWTMSLIDESGNPYPAGGYTTLYIDASGLPSESATSTSPYGVELIYNIDPSIAQYPTLVVTPPAGSACQPVNSFVGFTGRIEVGPGIFSEQGVFVE